MNTARKFFIAWSRPDGSVSPRIACWLLWIVAKLRRMCVRLKQPCGPLRIVAQQLLILVLSEITSPDDASVIDVGRVVDPLLKLVLRPVAHENQLLARGCRERLINGDAALGIAVVDVIPGFVGCHRGD